MENEKILQRRDVLVLFLCLKQTQNKDIYYIIIFIIISYIWKDP